MSDSDLVFRALANPSRRKLLDAFNPQDAHTLTELCEYLDKCEQPRLKAPRELKEAFRGDPWDGED